MDDFFESIGNGISNGVSATGDAAKAAAKYTAKQAKAAAEYTAKQAKAGYDYTAKQAEAGYDYTAKQAKAGYDYTAKQAEAGYQAVRRTAVRGRLWASDKLEWALDFSGGYPPNESFPKYINYEVFDRAGPPMPASGAWSATGRASTLSPVERSFIYLDVGHWGGSKYHKKARDFGIVCGRTVVLCAFQTDKGDEDAKNPLLNPHSRPEVDQINKLLAHLGKGSLGPVKVRRSLTARTMLPSADVTPDRIFVIVGDMHLPVITSLKDTHGPRMGRSPGSDDRDTQEQWIPTGEGPVIHIPAHRSNGGMVEQDAINWYCHYAGSTTGGVHDRQGADIFEEAGPDLSEFVRLLNAFSGYPLHLLQLGDMFDLWMGLERFYLEHPSRVVLNTNATNPDVNSWINHWTDRTLNGTSQSAHIKRFLGFTNGRKNWLYGNHDDYFAVSNPTSLMHASGNLKRQEIFDERQTRLYAAHGHKWDSFNRDGAKRGQQLTQLAFSAPLVRNIEPGGRQAALIGAAELFLSRESNPFCVFAMGHTHTAVLSRVTILNQT